MNGSFLGINSKFPKKNLLQTKFSPVIAKDFSGFDGNSNFANLNRKLFYCSFLSSKSHDRDTEHDDRRAKFHLDFSIVFTLFKRIISLRDKAKIVIR